MLRYIQKFIFLIRIFWKKPFTEKWMLTRVFLLLAFFRVLILFFPFKTIARYLGEQGKETTSVDVYSSSHEFMENTARFISNMSRLVPWESKCLVQAAAGKVMLNRKGIESTVYFGVKKNNEAALEAHAWLRVGPKIILGGEIASEFVVVSTFA
ncbi:MAG: lasso peptide biosynthesis B2 protein [Balneolaceae bacterium]|nr:MAG: lasso peptide biosynthesis B2 protein [Balneolaceae bacterium]